MNQPATISKTEPALAIGGSYAAVAVAIFALLESFGFGLDESQKTAIIGILPIVLAVISYIHIRLKVFSPATVEKLTKKK